MAQVLIRMRQREVATGGVVSQSCGGHHHPDVGWDLPGDGVAALKSRLAG